MTNIPITVRVPEDMKARWEAAAKLDGVSLSEFVRTTVEHALAPARPLRSSGSTVSTFVSPEDCKVRLPAGSWCRRCGTIHQKGLRA